MVVLTLKLFRESYTKTMTIQILKFLKYYLMNYHSSSKQKSVRGNYVPFIAKELRKAIMSKSKAKNSYVKCPSRENFVTYKNAKTKCNYVIH